MYQEEISERNLKMNAKFKKYLSLDLIHLKSKSQDFLDVQNKRFSPIWNV